MLVSKFILPNLQARSDNDYGLLMYRVKSQEMTSTAHHFRLSPKNTERELYVFGH